jgi:hypothetical protein
MATRKAFTCQRCNKAADPVFLILSIKAPCVGMKFCEKCIRWFLKAVAR